MSHQEAEEPVAQAPFQGEEVYEEYAHPSGVPPLPAPEVAQPEGEAASAPEQVSNAAPVVQSTAGQPVAEATSNSVPEQLGTAAQILEQALGEGTYPPALASLLLQQQLQALQASRAQASQAATQQGAQSEAGQQGQGAQGGLQGLKLDSLLPNISDLSSVLMGMGRGNNAGSTSGVQGTSAGPGAGTAPKPIVRRTVYSSTASLGNVQVASPSLGIVKHRSKKHSTIVLSPNHLIHVPRTFLQEHYDVEDILKNGLRVQIDADGKLDPDVVETTVANYQNKSGYSYHRLLGFKPVCRKYLNWKVIGWQAVDRRTVRLCISAPDPTLPTSLENGILPLGNGLGNGVDHASEQASEASRPAKVPRGRTVASAPGALAAGLRGGAWDVGGFGAGPIATGGMGNDAGGLAQNGNGLGSLVQWDGGMGNVLYVSSNQDTGVGVGSSHSPLGPQGVTSQPQPQPIAEIERDGGRVQVILDPVTGQVQLQQVQPAADTAAYPPPVQQNPPQNGGFLPPAPGTAYIASLASGQVVAVVNTGAGALSIPIVQPPLPQQRQQQELLLQALTQQPLPQAQPAQQQPAVTPSSQLGSMTHQSSLQSVQQVGSVQQQMHGASRLGPGGQQQQPQQVLQGGPRPAAQNVQILSMQGGVPQLQQQLPQQQDPQPQHLLQQNTHVQQQMLSQPPQIQQQTHHAQQQQPQQQQQQMQSMQVGQNLVIYTMPTQSQSNQQQQPQQQAARFVVTAGGQLEPVGNWLGPEAGGTVISLQGAQGLNQAGAINLVLEGNSGGQQVNWGLQGSVQSAQYQPSHSSGTM